MKKLNITKEQFNKSQYFQKKYGELKYVSESGRYFKTNKGKVLKFNESDDFDDEGHLDSDEDTPTFTIGEKVIWNDSLWKIVDCWYDSIVGINLYDLEGLDTGEETSDVPGDELCRYDGGIAYESNRKFGRKFVKESTGQGVKVVAHLEIVADTIDDALQNMHDELLNVDAGITDGNENPNPEIIEKYEYWNGENDGDVDFTVYRRPGVEVDVKNV